MKGTCKRDPATMPLLTAPDIVEPSGTIPALVSNSTAGVVPVPSQRLFTVRSAARYLDLHPNTVRKYADLGIIRAVVFFDDAGRKHRRFTLEALDSYIDSLVPWYDAPGEESGTERRSHGNQQGS